VITITQPSKWSGLHPSSEQEHSNQQATKTAQLVAEAELPVLEYFHRIPKLAEAEL
jgi:hypothetical protein